MSPRVVLRLPVAAVRLLAGRAAFDHLLMLQGGLVRSMKHLAVALLLAAPAVHGAEHVVTTSATYDTGDGPHGNLLLENGRGFWTAPTTDEDPKISYDPITAAVGDSLLFYYTSSHDVVKSPSATCPTVEAGADALVAGDVLVGAADAGGAAIIGDSLTVTGDAFAYIVTEEDLAAGTIYFTCSYPAYTYAHCTRGQLLAVTVEAAPPVTFTEHVLSSDVTGGASVVACDVDGDGVDDIVAAEHLGKIAWFRSPPGDLAPGFELPEVMSGLRGLTCADLDGDGALDIVAAAMLQDSVWWFRNNGGTFERIEISEGLVDRAAGIAAGDFDGDGAVDIAVAGGALATGSLAWCRNAGPGGDGTDWLCSVLDEGMDTVVAVAAGDVDGDGLLDIVSQRASDPTPAWWRNEGGGFAAGAVLVAGSTVYPSLGSSNQHWITQSLTVADLAGNGAADVVAGRWPGDVTVYVNGGAGSSFTEKVVHAWGLGGNKPRCEGATTADIDGDGLLDLVANYVSDYTASGGDMVDWFQQQAACEAAPCFAGPYPVSSPEAVDEATAACAADFDGDGDEDVAVTAEGLDAVHWYENNRIDATATNTELTTSGAAPRAALSTRALGAFLVATAAWSTSLYFAA